MGNPAGNFNPIPSRPRQVGLQTSSCHGKQRAVFRPQGRRQLAILLFVFSLASPFPQVALAEARISDVDLLPEQESDLDSTPAACAGTASVFDGRAFSEGELWTLFHNGHCSGVEISGWISGGATVNADGNRSGNGNAPYGYNNVSDGVVLNQLWLCAEKAVDTGGCGFDVGFHMDYFFGVDGPDNQAYGDETWDFGWNSARDYGSAIPQLYAEIGIDDLTIKAGYFYTILGCECPQACDNIFYSHTYAFYYSEPNTHSGFLARFALSDHVTLLGGWTLGMDGTFSNHLHASTFLGGVDLTVTEATSVHWAVLAGDWGDGTGRAGVDSYDGTIYLNTITVEHRITDRLTCVLEHHLGANWRSAGDDGQWYGVVQYLTYEVSDCWQVSGRFEWYRDEDGTRLGLAATDAGSYFDATVGLNWNPHVNLTIRPELRWDWFEGSQLPYDNGTEDDFFTFGVDAVFTF